MALTFKRKKYPSITPKFLYLCWLSYFAFRQFQIDVILIWDFATGAMICLVSEKTHGACPRTETTKFLRRLLQDKTTERNLVRLPARLLLSDYSFIYFCILRVSISCVSIAQRRLGYSRGRGTPIYELYRYVPRNRVWFFRFSVLK